MSPVELLAEAVSKSISKNWRRIRERGSLSVASKADLGLAFDYFNQQSKAAHQIADDRRVKAAEEEFERKNRSEHVEPLSNADALVYGLFFLLLAILALALVVILILNYPRETLLVAAAIAIIWLAWDRLSAFLEQASSRIPHRWSLIFPSVMIVVFVLMQFVVFRELSSWTYFLFLPYLLIFVGLGIFNVLGLITTPEFAWEAVGGRAEWLHSTPVDVLDGERLAILNAMSESTAAQSTGSVPLPGRATSDAPALPAPPGVTEIVLEQSQTDVFREMRDHLTSVRRYHKIVLWVLIGAFMTFFGVGVYKLLVRVQTPADYFQAFGSSGIGALLLWFGQRTLWANRVSQLSLALFESHVAEVTSSLREIPSNLPSEERRRIRGEIWTEFREGLNSIWLSEKKLLDDGVDGSRRTTLPRGPEKEPTSK